MTQNELCPDHQAEYINIKGKQICVVEWLIKTTEGKRLYDIRKRPECVQVVFADWTVLEFRYVYVVGEDGCDTAIDDANSILNTLENLYVCDVSYIPAQEQLDLIVPALIRMDFSINPDAEPLAYLVAEFTLIRNWVDLEFNEPD